MQWDDIPEDFKNIWEALDRKGQRKLLTMLGSHMKPMKYRLRMEADVNKVGKTLLYIQKHSIPYSVTRKGKQVVFIFDGQDVRNQVLLGRCTI